MIQLDGLEKITVVDKFFKVPSKFWLAENSLPKQPLRIWNITEDFMSHKLVNSQVPMIYGGFEDSCELFKLSRHSIFLDLDIFGSAFFILTRYEEFVRLDKDQFDRFPATASLAYQEGFLHRPIVNEYAEILWACMKKLWPGLERQPRKFQMHVSHDVDCPYQYTFTNFPLLARNLAGDLIKRRNPEQSLSRIRTWNQVKQGNLAADPFNTFNWLMDLSEKHSLISAFYFITDTTDKKRDGNYSIHHPAIRQLIRHIHQRGHEIGLHPSFNTYLDAAQTQKEFDILHR
ncbi:MAG: hypothetical protein AAF620_16845, partial [Bacteroidota bacterium]